MFGMSEMQSQLVTQSIYLDVQVFVIAQPAIPALLATKFRFLLEVQLGVYRYFRDLMTDGSALLHTVDCGMSVACAYHRLMHVLNTRNSFLISSQKH